jgi:putative spermidine/putrescine transport system ATP-binding protein
VAQLTLSGVCKVYGSTHALAPTDMTIADGEFVTLLGPSGCGKTTLLRIVAGITPATGGRVILGGKRIEMLPPERRDIAMVFQTYALFPHLNVRKNLNFGLRMKKVASAEQEHRIEHAVAICKLDGLLERMPRQLSGGQQQRVALARAIVMQPALLLFDEPLSNLDAKLRDSLRDELVALHRTLGMTSLYVTHDQSEAMAMSDRIMVMNGGRIVETGTPLQLYRNPVAAFTAEFLGQTNLLSLPAIQDGSGYKARLPWGQMAPVDDVAASAATVRVSLRPEDIMLKADPDGQAEITAASFVGAQTNYELRIAQLNLRASISGVGEMFSIGQRVHLNVSARLRALRAEDSGKAGRAL